MVEAGRDISFEMKRAYFLYGLDSTARRGFHAHKKLHQLAVCVSGSCLFALDDGREKAETILDSPNKGLLLGPMLWREMYNFSTDCVLLVLASAHYDEDDYIRDYEEFRQASCR